jgi:putative ABC transport system permease protein
MGIGIVITGLGSVLIADAIKNWTGIRKIGRQIALVVIGCIVFQSVLAFTLSIGIDPNLLKMVTALFVLLIVALPKISKSFSKGSA